MSATILYGIRQKLLAIEPDQLTRIGNLTVQLLITETAARWVIRGAGVTQVFRYPPRQGRQLQARVEVGAYLIGHYRRGEWWVNGI